AGGKGPAEPFDLAIAGGIERCLQLDVQRPRTNAAPVHRTQHLDVADRIEAEPLGDPCLRQFNDAAHGGFRIVRLHEIEVALGSSCPRRWCGAATAICGSTMTSSASSPRPMTSGSCRAHMSRPAHQSNIDACTNATAQERADAATKSGTGDNSPSRYGPDSRRHVPKVVVTPHAGRTRGRRAFEGEVVLLHRGALPLP